MQPRKVHWIHFKLFIKILKCLLFSVIYTDIVIWNHTAYGLIRFHQVRTVGPLEFAWKTSKGIPRYYANGYLCNILLLTQY